MVILTNKNTPPEQKLPKIIRMSAITPYPHITPFTTALFTIGLGMGLGLGLRLELELTHQGKDYMSCWGQDAPIFFVFFEL